MSFFLDRVVRLLLFACPRKFESRVKRDTRFSPLFDRSIRPTCCIESNQSTQSRSSQIELQPKNLSDDDIVLMACAVSAIIDSRVPVIEVC